MEITAILAVAFVTAVLALVLKGQREELSFAISVAGGCVVFYLLLNGIISYIAQMGGFLSKTQVDSGYFAVIFKALGICYLTQFVSDLCRDYGQTSLAGRVDLAGKCCVLILAAPLMERLIETAARYIE